MRRTPNPRALLLVSAAALGGCASVRPPASAPLTADDALARMHATFACASAIQANAKIDHFGEHGRVRGDLMLFAARPARIRMDVVSPFGVALATLTSDGHQFALADLRDKTFFTGPADACNIARLTTVPVPGHVLVDLLHGEAPVLKHEGGGATIAWDSHGWWVLQIPSTREAREEIHLAPRPEDWARPWDQQRMRVLDVRVVQQGYVLYHAELGDHATEPTAGPRIDPDNIDPPIPPSGPVCDAEVPRKIHVEVPVPEADVRFTYQKLEWNPPMPEGTFVQPVPQGMRVEPVSCGN
ncbi:MAG: LolA family protein [Polyangiaceae bacterium]